MDGRPRRHGDVGAGVEAVDSGDGVDPVTERTGEASRTREHELAVEHFGESLPAFGRTLHLPDLRLDGLLLSLHLGQRTLHGIFVVFDGVDLLLLLIRGRLNVISLPYKLLLARVDLRDPPRLPRLVGLDRYLLRGYLVDERGVGV